MTDAYAIKLADAVKNVLNGALLSLPFTAERSYVPIHDLKDLTPITVTVVPATVTATTLDRSMRRETQYVIDVGVQQHFGDGAMTNAMLNDAVDPLMFLVEEITNLFNTPDLAGLPEAASIGVENMPIFDPKHFDEMRLFTSVIRLTFNVYR